MLAISTLFFLVATISPGFVAGQASYAGFTTYTQLTEGADNSGTVAYTAPYLSTTLYVNVQILNNSGPHTQLFQDFTNLCKNYGANGISLIPRLRYGTADGIDSPEPNNSTTVLNDVSAWAKVALKAQRYCDIPLVQAGTLGEYGEWHDGPFCMQSGQAASAGDKAIKLQIVQTLLDVTTVNVAVRNPQDYAVILPSLTEDEANRFTMHDDCILAEGPTGGDEGTFVQEDNKSPAQWRQYTIDKTGGNIFGGEPCGDPSGYDWSNTGLVCSTGSQGLAAYINTMQIAYLNPGNPTAFYNLFLQAKGGNSTALACIERIQSALQANT